MKKRARLTCIALLCCGPALAAEETASSPAPSPTPGVPRTMLEVDAAIDSMSATVWDLPARLNHPSAKAGEPSLEDDIAEYLMTDAMLKALADERQRLSRLATDANSPVPEHELHRLSDLAFQEHCRRTILVNYWRGDLSPPIAYRQEIMQALLQRMPEGPRLAMASELDELGKRAQPSRADMARDMESCQAMEDVPAFVVRSVELGEAYDELRTRMVASINAMQSGEPRQWQQRRAPCPAPATPAPGGRPSMRTAPDALKSYPAKLRVYGISGTVHVILSYDAGGCVTEASIGRTSGVDALDQAALEAAFDTELVPGEVDGKPRSGRAVLPVRYSTIDDTGLPASPSSDSPPQPQP